MKKFLLTIAAVVSSFVAGSGTAWADDDVTLGLTLPAPASDTVFTISPNSTDDVKGITVSSIKGKQESGSNKDIYYNYNKIKAASSVYRSQMTIDGVKDTIDSKNEQVYFGFKVDIADGSYLALSQLDLSLIASENFSWYVGIFQEGVDEPLYTSSEHTIVNATSTDSSKKKVSGHTLAEALALNNLTNTTIYVKVFYWLSSKNPSKYITATKLTVTGALSSSVVVPTCGEVEFSTSPFDFANKMYTVSLSTPTTDASIYYTTSGEDETTLYTGPIEITQATTISAHAELANYNSSESSSKSFIGYDATKPYVAWAYQAGYNTYSTANDPLYAALSEEYNVVPVVAASKSVAYTTAASNWTSADLVVISEAMAGDATFSNGLKEIIGQVPVINMKAFNYGKTADQRWKWGVPSNASYDETAITPASGNFKLLEGLTVENGEINLFDNIDASKNHLQTVTLNGADAPSDQTTLATVDDNINIHAGDKYVLLGISSDDIAHANDNAKQLIKNAAKLLLAGDVTAAAEASELGTVSFAAMPYATFFSEQATIVPEGVVAYTAAWSNKQTFLNLNEVKGYIPAETAVILKDTTNAVSATLQSTIYTVAAVDGNVLMGAKEDLTTPTDHDVYTLSVANDVVAFRKYTGTKLNAGKAYLELPTSAAIPMIRIAGDDTDEPGNVSGINAVTIENRAADVIYDLRGRRVQSLDRSGLYIVNGKKVVVK